MTRDIPKVGDDEDLGLPTYCGDDSIDRLIEAAYIAGARAAVGIDNQRPLADLVAASERLLDRLSQNPLVVGRPRKSTPIWTH